MHGEGTKGSREFSRFLTVALPFMSAGSPWIVYIRVSDRSNCSVRPRVVFSAPDADALEGAIYS